MHGSKSCRHALAGSRLVFQWSPFDRVDGREIAIDRFKGGLQPADFFRMFVGLPPNQGPLSLEKIKSVLSATPACCSASSTLPTLAGLALHLNVGAADSYWRERRRREQLRNEFARYVPPAVVDAARVA